MDQENEVKLAAIKNINSFCEVIKKDKISLLAKSINTLLEDINEEIKSKTLESIDTFC